MKKTEGLPFEWSRYGALVRNERTRLGYKTAEAFAETIWRRSRVSMSGVSVLRIEQGNQVPDAMQFMGINISLFGSPFPRELTDPGMSEEWSEITDAYSARSDVSPISPYIPQKWRLENTEAAQEAEADGYAVVDADELFIN